MKNLLILIFILITINNIKAQDKLSSRDGKTFGWHKNGRGYFTGDAYDLSSKNTCCWVENGTIYDANGTPSNSTSYEIVGFYENGKIYTYASPSSNERKFVGSYRNGELYNKNGKFIAYYEGDEKAAAVAGFVLLIVFEY